MMRIPFTKMVGAGNDFIIVDTIKDRLGRILHQWPAVSRMLCGRHRGVGADGVLVLERSEIADVRMRVFNPDGSEAETCGNGLRCVAHFVNSRPYHRRKHVLIETAGGLANAVVLKDRVELQMPNPSNVRLGLTLTADGKKIRASFINTGVPHLVVPVKDLERIDVVRWGRALRYHKTLRPRGANVDFVKSNSAHGARELSVRTYERGVETETLACGTGVVASAIVYALNGTAGSLRHAGIKDVSRRLRFSVRPRSKDLMVVSFTASNQVPHAIADVVLDGPARRVYEGIVEVSSGGS